VDFAACSADAAISIGDGFVSSVQLSDGNDYTKGDMVIIGYDTADGGIAVIYAHLTNLTVTEGAAVRRGDRIGSIWKPISFIWQPHIHIQILNRRDSKADPLHYLGGCQSRASRDLLVYPIPC
jgi:murein DD-endopeptidase MepM/ murein hydrolase activator NlpD